MVRLSVWTQMAVVAALSVGFSSALSLAQVATQKAPKPVTDITKKLRAKLFTKVNTASVLTCPTETADRYILLQPGSPYYGEVKSNGTAYNTRGCKGFLIDVTVAPGGWGWTEKIILSGAPTGWNPYNLSKSACEQHRVTMAVFKRVIRSTSSGSQHSTIAYESIQAKSMPMPPEWGGKYCEGGLSFEIPVPTRENDSGQPSNYRIWILPTRNGNPLAASLHWSEFQPPT